MIGLLEIASIVAGLGLFLTGLRNLAANMMQLGGPTLRRAVAAHGRNPALIALTGLAAGAFLQSNLGITFIMISMVSAGMVPTLTAMPLLLWANLGTSALVVVATTDFRVVTLMSLGIAGIWLFLDRANGTMRRQILESVLAIAMLFMGLELMRSGSGSVQSNGAIARGAELLGTSPGASFLMGLVMTLFTQSSSATTIIAMTARESGLLPFHSATLLVIGATFGSGISAMLVGGSTRGSQRQLVLFQGLSKLIGIAILMPPLILEDAADVPMLQAGVEAVVAKPGPQLALIYIICGFSAILGYAILSRPIYRLLTAIAPPLPAESLAVPQFIYDAAAGDPDTALILVEKEQTRVTSHLALSLETPDPATAASIERLSEEVERFLNYVAGSPENAAVMPRPQLDHLANLRARNEVLRLLHDTVFQLGQVCGRLPAGEVAELADALVQGLGAVLMCADDSARDADPDSIALLKRISSDRSTAVDAIRRRLVQAANQELIYRMTSLFERAVWLVQRYALLLEAVSPA